MNKKWFGIPTLLILALILLGAAQNIVYDGLLQGQSRATVSAADSVAPLDSSDYVEPAVPVQGRTHVTLTAHVGSASTASTLALVRGTIRDGQWVPMSYSIGTSKTSSATFKYPDGTYVRDDDIYDTCGYTHFKVVVVAVAAGNISVRYSLH